jgi:hypothetical protein
MTHSIAEHTSAFNTSCSPLTLRGFSSCEDFIPHEEAGCDLVTFHRFIKVARQHPSPWHASLRDALGVITASYCGVAAVHFVSEPQR